jgi:Protein of unknown function (DUF2800)
MIDERLNRPSASSAHRRRRCVGSENLIAQLRAKGLLKEMPQSEDAKSGTLVHRAWAREPVELSSQQSRTLNELCRLEALVIADWAGEQSYTLIGREERLWLHDGITPLLSGQYDVAYRTQDWRRVLILDAKTLYGEVDPAQRNDQLRELVALFCHNYPRIEHFTVAILFPNLAERCSVAGYDRLEAQLALRLTRYTLAESQDPQAPRTPGSYCDHCPAVLNCEEARGLVGATYNLAKRIEQGEFTLPLGEKGSRLLDSIMTAESVLKALKGAYKRELEFASDCLPGWRLKNGKQVRQITDIEAAMELAVQDGFTLKEFLSCAELSIGRLEQHFGSIKGLSGRALTNRFKSVFEPLITFKQYAPELERVKQKALK